MITLHTTAMLLQRNILLVILVILSSLAALSQDIEQAIKAKPFTWTGSVGAGSEFYTSNAMIDRYSPYTWQFNGNFTMTLFEALSMPFSFTIGKQVKEFSQPFFQMGVSPSYKWATLHAGFRNMTFNPYTLNGATFAGVGVELNPAWFRFSTMFGRFAKATEADPMSSSPEFPAYRRLGYGTKIGFGKENNYIDLSFFKSKDDSSSITRPDPSTYEIRPEDNMAFGVSTKQVMWTNLTFLGDYGLSFFTADQGATPGEEKTPLKGNTSTTTSHAVKASLAYAFPTAKLGFSYERVDPGYKSHGSYYFSDDFEHILFTPSWSMWKEKVSVSVSAGLQRNNLYADKEVRDFRLANSVGVNANLSQIFGFDINYSNFSMNQKSTSSLILTDYNKVKNVSHNLNLGPRFTFMDEQKVQSVVANYNLQVYNDKNAESSSMADNNSHFASVNYNVSFIPTGWNVFTGVNATAFSQEITNLKQFGVSGGFSKAFVENTLSTSLNTTYNVSLLDKKYDGGVYNLGINTAYTLKKQHSFALTLGVLNNMSKTSESFTEFRGGVKYNFTIR